MSTAPAAPATILVVEDEETIRLATRRALTRRGYAVLLAEDGAQALQLLEGGPDVHLVLTDLTMPTMSGRELVRRIEASRPGLPIVLMSGFAGDLAEFGDPADGGYPFLQKPFSLEALGEAVKAALGKERER